MSSDYIPRLRRELLRAGSTKQARWGRARAARGLRPIVAAAAVALVAVAVVLALPGGKADETGVGPATDALRMTFRVDPPGAATAERTAEVMRARLATAGIDADVAVSADAGLTISAPAAARADVTTLAQPGRIAFYDWERSVLGPDGKRAVDPAGGTPGQPVGITREQAEARAAGVPGARVARADFGGGDERWFALGGDPALTAADIDRAEPAVDEATQDPIVTIGFTARGEAAFATLTRELAHRGSVWAAAGADDLEAYQHFAIVVDDRILSLPYIGFREAPNGLDGSDGTQIQGGLEPETARLMAAVLSSGPLPGALSDPGAQPQP